MSTEKKVQVCKTGETKIDDDFEAIRKRFQDNMRQMEEEMSRFKGSLLTHQRDLESRPMSPSSRQREISSFAESLESPLIKETPQGKCLKLEYDLTDYAPEEIVVTTVGNKLQVRAKHEERTDSRSEYREYSREFLLPEGTDPDQVRSSLSADGVLTIEAPLPKSDQKRVPIDRK